MRVIDSHTEGEPTRVILSGGPDLGSGPLSERQRIFARQFDSFRRAVTLEPRGSDALVGALLCEPHREDCDAGVIFFNNTGYLGMCGHASIGLAVTLHYLERAPLGTLRLDTPVGPVSVQLHDANTATITNVPSYRYRSDVNVVVEGLGSVQGDIAWGGNWFFLVKQSPVPLESNNIKALSDAAGKVRRALTQHGITGADGAEIDHVEFFGPAHSEHADSRNFVLCPGGAYDRSPCGTGTSAKLACLAADGLLQPEQRWVQESIIGSHFEASYQWAGAGRITPSITGRAYICSDANLVCQPLDPFAEGIVAA